MADSDKRTMTAPSLAPQADARFGLAILDAEAPRFVPLPQGTYDVGRDDDCVIRIIDAAASRRHARILVGDAVSIQDLDSKNGTSLEGRRLKPLESVPFRVGAAAEIGGTALVLQRASSRLPIARSSRDARTSQTASSDPPWLVLADRIATDTVSVVILGETGAGKEVLATRIHQRSKRAGGPLIRVHPAAISPALFESELFGHERGAFTGASRDHIGLVERADGGTLFIDEIGELPLEGQVKLLRLLEDRIVRRVGARTERAVDVRFLAATNRDLEEEIERGRFRSDLYFRLAGMVLRVPPLRDRLREVQPLAMGFLTRWCAERDRPMITVDDDVWSQLLDYRWPGNVRELRVFIEHAALVCDGVRIRTEDLPATEMRRRASSVSEAPRPPTPPKATEERTLAIETDEDPRRGRIRDALARSAGNQTEAAKLLGVTRRTLSNWLNELGLPRPRKGPGA